MIENGIVASQFGCPGKPLVPSECGDRFGSPLAIAASQPTDVLRREAALLLAETGLRFAAIARRLGLGRGETADALAPSPWRTLMPVEEDESALVWKGGGGFRPLSVSEMHVLIRDLDDAGHLAVRRLKAGSRKSEAIERLIRYGFLRRADNAISITAHGEALLYRQRAMRV